MAQDMFGGSAPPLVPVITAPANLLTGVIVTLGLGIVLTSPANATSVDIRITTGPNGTGSVVYSSNGASVLGVTVPALTLSAGQTYYISVRSNGVTGSSPYSADVQIST